jgi:hypothetical protein
MHASAQRCPILQEGVCTGISTICMARLYRWARTQVRFLSLDGFHLHLVGNPLFWVGSKYLHTQYFSQLRRNPLPAPTVTRSWLCRLSKESWRFVGCTAYSVESSHPGSTGDTSKSIRVPQVLRPQIVTEASVSLVTIHNLNISSLETVPRLSVGSTSVATQVACNLQLCIDSFLIVLCSAILNYKYHLCGLDVVASGIDDIIVQTLSACNSFLRKLITSRNVG